MKREMVLVPPGEFIYRVEHLIQEGDCQYDHGPRFIKIDSFYADKFPVTNYLFACFLGESGYDPPDKTNFLRHWKEGACPAALLDHPITWISQTDAKAYASFYGCRLAKDFEWQYMAGGPEKLAFPWGEHFNPDLCNSKAGAEGDTTPVGKYPGGAGPFGNMDLCGNAWEWVDDVIDDGMHIFTFLRGGSSYAAPDFWHALGGPHKNNYHLKMQLLNEGINRSGTVSFRCIKDYK